MTGNSTKPAMGPGSSLQLVRYVTVATTLYGDEQCSGLIVPFGTLKSYSWWHLQGFRGIFISFPPRGRSNSGPSPIDPKSKWRHQLPQIKGTRLPYISQQILTPQFLSARIMFVGGQSSS